MGYAENLYLRQWGSFYKNKLGIIFGFPEGYSCCCCHFLFFVSPLFTFVALPFFFAFFTPLRYECYYILLQSSDVVVVPLMLLLYLCCSPLLLLSTRTHHYFFTLFVVVIMLRRYSAFNIDVVSLVALERLFVKLSNLFHIALVKRAVLFFIVFEKLKFFLEK